MARNKKRGGSIRKGMNRENRIEIVLDLVNAFSSVKKPLETSQLLQDLLTAKEIMNLSVRLRIAKLLLQGKTYEEIKEKTGTSTATITKVRMWLERDGQGFKQAVEKLPKRYNMPKRLPKIPIELQLPQALLALVQYGLAKKGKESTRKVEKLLKDSQEKRKIDLQLQKVFDAHYKKVRR